MSKVHLIIMEPDHLSNEARQVLAERYRITDFGAGLAEGAEAMVAGLSHRLDSKFLGTFENLRLVASLTTGTTHIDCSYLDSRGIRLVTLSSVRGDIAQVGSTAELAIGLILSVVRRIPQAQMSILEEGVWDRMRFFGPELRGRRLGLIGFGRIGRMVWEMGRSLGLEVSAFDPMEIVPNEIRAASLDVLVEDSEVVSMHASYSGHQILTEREIRLMRPGAFLVNTARGELVSEQAVVGALRSGQLGGYASDVLCGENLPEWDIKTDPLVVLAREGYNVAITPHLGGCTSEGFAVTQVAMAKHLVRLADGGDFFRWVD